jgi:hypothetical protein
MVEVELHAASVHDLAAVPIYLAPQVVDQEV